MLGRHANREPPPKLRRTCRRTMRSRQRRLARVSMSWRAGPACLSLVVGRTMNRALFSVFLLALVTGCGPLYLLPGSSRHPHPVTMKVGERRKAISKGVNLFSPQPASSLISSDDTNIVSFEFPDRYTAYIRAERPGTAKLTLHSVTFSHPTEHYAVVTNSSFEVHVIERK